MGMIESDLAAGEQAASSTGIFHLERDLAAGEQASSSGIVAAGCQAPWSRASRHQILVGGSEDPWAAPERLHRADMAPRW